MARKNDPFKVPDEIMIPIGAWGTREFKAAAENWTDDHVAMLQLKLPPQYHAVPLHSLRKQWVNIRKKN